MPATIDTLTPPERSKLLTLHPFTVTRLASEWKPPVFKVGGVCLPARLCGGAVSEGCV